MHALLSLISIFFSISILGFCIFNILLIRKIMNLQLSSLGVSYN